jgi:hypothetical protein
MVEKHIFMYKSKYFILLGVSFVVACSFFQHILYVLNINLIFRL